MSEDKRFGSRTMTFESMNWKARYEEASVERDRLRDENESLNSKMNNTTNLPQKEFVKKIEDLTSQKENLTKENLQLLKVIKKLHRKAEDRKKNLKQLFELMTEKEKEIEHYKKNQLKNMALDQGTKGDDGSKNKNGERERRHDVLDSEIKRKEKELKQLENLISNRHREFEAINEVKVH